MLNKPQQYGINGEKIAAGFLVKNGYRILEKNYRTKLGEIDIVANHKGTIVFIEVKARKNFKYGNPKHAVTLRKQKKISMVALLYLKRANLMDHKARFDVVTVCHTNALPEVEIIKNAFDLAIE